jgi:hypothetical protein
MVMYCPKRVLPGGEAERSKMTDRPPLAEQLEVIERLLERAKAERDWPTIAPLKATADLIRWTIANAETLKAAAAVVKHPAVRAVLDAFPDAEISAIREIAPSQTT